MIAVIQRARDARVTVEGRKVGGIARGLVILLGIFREDGIEDARFMAEKIARLRIFNDADGKLNLSLQDVSGSALVISQFTLCGDWRKGRRPSFINAAAPDKAEALYNEFKDFLRQEHIPVESGIFGAMMDVSLVNDGPVTFVLDSRLK